MAWAILVVMGGAFLVTVMISIRWRWSQVILTKNGVSIYNPRLNFAFNFSRNDLQALEMKGRILRVVLKNPPFGMYRKTRHVTLGDSRKREEFAQAVQSFGSSLASANASVLKN